LVPSCSSKPSDQALAAIAGAAPGTGHDTVYREACRVFAVTDDDQVEEALIAAAIRACSPSDRRDRERAVRDARAFVRGWRAERGGSR
jgi:hypothetical protein